MGELAQIHLKVDESAPTSAPASAGPAAPPSAPPDDDITSVLVAPAGSMPPQYRLRHQLLSHLDGVRALSFHPSLPLLLSGSEDATLKVWNLKNLLPQSGKPPTDLEPIVTLRGHQGPIFACAMSPEYQLMFSAGADSTIRVWGLPPPNLDPYASHGVAIPYKESTYTFHTDAVWSLALHPVQQAVLASASADGTARLFHVGAASPLVSTFVHPGAASQSAPPAAPGTARPNLSKELRPCVCDFVKSSNNNLAVGYTNGDIVLFDTTAGKEATVLHAAPSSSPAASDTSLCCMALHPTLPLAIAGHADRTMRFYDLNSGRCIHQMVAHTDAVACMDMAPSGLHLVTGGHDCSVRFWDIRTRACVHECSTHRPKYQEGIHAVRYHATGPLLATGGADSVIKIFM